MSVDFPPDEATKAALRRLLGVRGYDAYFREEIHELVRQGLGRVIPIDDGEALPPGARLSDAPREPERFTPPLPVQGPDVLEFGERTARELAEDRRRRFPDFFDDVPRDDLSRRKF